MLKGMAGGLCQIAVLAAALLLPAGRWPWTRALQFLGMYGLVMLVSIAALARFAPANLEARLQRPSDRSQPLADRVVTANLIIMLAAWFVFIPIDVFHLKLLPPPPLILSSFGVTLLIGGYGIILAALFQNAFAAPIVMDQSDRGQVLVDTGIYQHLRHPFYLGLLLFLAGTALWLESLAAVLAEALIIVVLILRIAVEEKALCKTLPGYVKYMTSVRYRLVPGIW